MASKRNYLSQAELAEYADITITNASEADDQISMAEEMIDGYVGFQQKFYGGYSSMYGYDYSLYGSSGSIYGNSVAALAAGGTTNTLTLNVQHQNIDNEDFYAGCQIEILGGMGVGQRRIIQSSTKAGVITTTTNWATPPDSTSFYKIYQLGKFPRRQDVYFDGISGANKYYKSIPEAVKRAVAAQVEYIINMGTDFFAGNDSDKESERIGDYSYTNAQGSAGINKLIAPKAKILLRGIRNIKGTILV